MAGKHSRYFMVRRRPDRNQKPIADALKAVGMKVADTSGVGGGFADLTVLRPDRTVVLLEVKTATGKLEKSQKEAHESWPVVVVRTPEEALAAVGIGNEERKAVR